jgi:peptidoglycan/LPS O-acetylase OafA/YrhL
MSAIEIRTLANRVRAFAKPQYIDGYQACYADIPTLDGLRALSIIVVMMSHLAIPQVPGGHGVFLFFIISGFLITRLLFAEQLVTGRIKVGQFYVRRFFRLYPAIIIHCILISSVYAIKDGKIDYIEPASVLFYFSNYLVAHRDLSGAGFQIEPIKIFWSLSVEEHFYFVFPVVFLFLRSALRIAIAAALVCVMALLLRVLCAELQPHTVGTHYLYMRTEFRMDSVAFGVLLAALCELKPAARWLDVLTKPVSFYGAILVGVMSIGMGGVYFANVRRYVILGPAICVVMLGLIFSPRYGLFQALLNLPLATIIGRLSYSLYIWHLPAQALTWWLLSVWTAVIVSSVLSFGLAAASFYGVERPMMSLRRRFGSHSPR